MPHHPAVRHFREWKNAGDAKLSDVEYDVRQFGAVRRSIAALSGEIYFAVLKKARRVSFYCDQLRANELARRRRR